MALCLNHPSIFAKFLNLVLTKLNLCPPYLPFQAISLICRVIYTFTVFLSLLIPLYQQPQQPASKSEDLNKIKHQQLDQLANLAQEVQVDASKLLNLELIPFKVDERKKGELRKVLKS